MSEQTASETSDLRSESPSCLADSTGSFAELVAEGTPAPGGGSVAAYCGVLAAALGRMMCNLTIGKKKYEQVQPRVKQIRAEIEGLSARLREIIDEDAASFERVMAAYRMPKENTEQAAKREQAIEIAGRDAIAAPRQTAKYALAVLKYLAELSKIGNPNAFPDLTTGSHLALVAVKGASYNIGVNLPMLKDQEFVDRSRQMIKALIEESEAYARQIEDDMLAKM